MGPVIERASQKNLRSGINGNVEFDRLFSLVDERGLMHFHGGLQF
jgi:hypothetical protein